MSVKPPKHICYSSDEEAGIRRSVSEGDFIYYDASGHKVDDQKQLARIADMVIPPAWTDVWICPNHKGHLQATGYDAKGRKQYRYHEDWTEYKQQCKFAKLSIFGSALPKIRKTIEADLAQENWSKSRVLALVVTLLDEHYLRIGNAYYREKNQTIGLTTLRRKHLTEEGAHLKFTYRAKSGKDRNITLRNKTLIRLIKETSELPGYEVFRYLDAHGKSQKIDSKDVNEYLHVMAGDEITAKDFRTWGATVLAIDFLPAARQDVADNPKLKLETALVRRVAKKLGNTIATCREYYIHPAILEAINQNNIPVHCYMPKDGAQREWLSPNECAVLQIIDNN